jgi:hypothetical protein
VRTIRSRHAESPPPCATALLTSWQLLPSFLYARLPEFVKAWQYKTFFPKDASPESTEHLKLLIDYIHTEYATQVSDYVENIKLGKIKFSDLSCLFRADQLILKKKKNDGYQLLIVMGYAPKTSSLHFQSGAPMSSIMAPSSRQARYRLRFQVTKSYETSHLYQRIHSNFIQTRKRY